MFWSYGDNGTYDVSVIVSDPRGAADTAHMVIVISNVPPAISVSVPSQQAVGVSASTELVFSDSGALDTHVIAVNWGDGTHDSVTEGAGAQRDSLSHAYARAGAFSIQALIRDKDGGTATVAAGSPVLVFDQTEHRTIAGYDVFDLGTLGGNSAKPLDLNDYGQVVGSSRTSSGGTHAFVWDNGVMHDLGTLGYEGSVAQRINNAGVIAGAVWSVRNDDCYRNTVGAVWRNRVGAVLGSQAAVGKPVGAVAMDEAGDIAWSACGHEDPWAWLSQGNSWTPLGGLPGGSGHSWVYSMNEHNQIVGSTGAVYTGESPGAYPHAFIWDNGTMRDLGQLGVKPCPSHPDRNCSYASALSINESGQVVGYSTAADGSVHMVLWANGTVRDLWRLPASGPYPSRAVINDAGQVVGSSGGEAFFWSNAQLYPLGSLGGGGTQVVDMNEAGSVVGTSIALTGEQHAFVWTKANGMTDLGTGPHGFNNAWVVGISFSGDIAGFTTQCHSGSSCGFPDNVRAVLWRRN